MSKLNCPLHNFAVTNFCLSDDCIVPLCPACIGEHNSFHDQTCSRSQITTLEQALQRMQTSKSDNLNNIAKKLDSLKSILLRIKEMPNHIMNVLKQAKRVAIQQIQSLFTRLQVTLLKQCQKQSYKSASQITKLISSTQEYISKNYKQDYENIVRFCKGDKGRDLFQKIQQWSKIGGYEFELQKCGVTNFEYNKTSEIYLRQFVEKCIIKNKGKENQCFAFFHPSFQSSINNNITNVNNMINALDIKSSASNYYGEGSGAYSRNQEKAQYNYMKDSTKEQYFQGDQGRKMSEPSQTTGSLKFPSLNFQFTPGFSLMKKFGQ